MNVNMCCIKKCQEFILSGKERVRNLSLKINRNKLKMFLSKTQWFKPIQTVRDEREQRLTVIFCKRTNLLGSGAIKCIDLQSQNLTSSRQV